MFCKVNDLEEEGREEEPMWVMAKPAPLPT